jgi:hypothetical protein
MAPNSAPDSTDCTLGTAYLGSSDALLDSVKFYPAGSSSPRTQCGDLPFNEDPSNAGTVKLASRNLIRLMPYQSWSLGTRSTVSDTLAEVFRTMWQDSVRVYSDSAPANYWYDLVALAYRHSGDSDEVRDRTYEITALAQLWRTIPTPTRPAVSRADSHAVVSWTNPPGLLRRHVDSTEVFRRSESGSWGESPIVRLASDSTSYREVPGPGTWYYMIRFVSSRPTYVHEDDALHHISRPRSATSPDSSVTIGAAPWLRFCEGNFDPTIDCQWFSADSTAATQVFRGGSLRATVAASVTSWTDSSVTRSNTYVYTLRHDWDGFLGLFSDPDTVVADPLAPDGLSCAGTGDTEVTCLWGNTEHEIVQIWRRVGAHWSLVDEVAAGTDYSNEDDAHPGEDGDPLRPIRP